MKLMFRWLFPRSLFSSFCPFLFVAFAGSALGQNLTPDLKAPGCAVPPEKFLAARLAVWQQRLKLDDWKISIVFSHPSDLKPGTLGHIHWDVDKKTASIRVLSASDYGLPCPNALSDMDVTVVHELVHLVLSPLSRSDADRGNEEHAVDKLADALLKLDRQDQSPQVQKTSLGSAAK